MGGILFPYQAQRVFTKCMAARNYSDHLFRIRQDIVTGIIQIRKQNCTRSYLGVRLIRITCHKPQDLRKKINWKGVEMRSPMRQIEYRIVKCIKHTLVFHLVHENASRNPDK